MSNLPDRILVSEPGSFAQYTLEQRLPKVIEDALKANPYPPEIISSLNALRSEMAGGIVQPFADEGEDDAFWNQAWQAWQGVPWSQLPWFWAETYFYRRLLNAVKYFSPGKWFRQDPFAKTKGESCQLGLQRLVSLFEQVEQTTTTAERFRFWLVNSLWANQADYSNQASLQNAFDTAPAGSENVLADDSELAWQVVRNKARRVDFICDNAGPELLVDLAISDMLCQELAEEVVLHVKAQPLYISDTMPQDAIDAVNTMCADANPRLSGLGQRLQALLGDGRLVLRTHTFWTSCLTLFEIPADLLNDLASSSLVIFKGDVNYRRLLDDRHWPSTKPFAEIPNQVPTNYAALRTVKSELVCGLADGQAEAMQQRDVEWLTNGRWGLIQVALRPQRQINPTTRGARNGS